MNHERVNGADFYNFAEQSEAPSLVWWMGSDYLCFIWQSIQGLVCNQLEKPETLGVKSHGDPKFQTRVATNRDNKVSYVEIDWPMQLLLRDASGDLRLEVEMNYKYWANLDGSEPPKNNAAVNIVSQKRL